MKKRHPRTLSTGLAALKELYGATQLFRHLGFSSDDVYVMFDVVAPAGPFAGKKCVAAHLKLPERAFTYTVMPVRNPHKFTRQWNALCREANATPQDPQWEAMAKSSRAWAEQDYIIACMRSLGFSIPSELQKLN